MYLLLNHFTHQSAKQDEEESDGCDSYGFKRVLVESSGQSDW
jgi:hypothetical protein